MLLRIEINPKSNPFISASQSQSSTSAVGPTRTLHICPATAAAANHTDGILCCVGRKNADIVFENERSVSRSHCSLRLISAAKSESKSKGSRRKTSDKDVSGFPKEPETEEEIEACNEATDGIAIVLSDLGSKYGTKAYFEQEEKRQSNQQKSKDDEDETDDETDDEGIEMSVGIGSERLAGRGNNASALASEHSSHIIRPLEKNGSILLTPLSLRRNDRSHSNEHSSVTVQCGNALFRITRIPLKFCLSRIQSKEKKELETTLCPLIGATITSALDCDAMTHLITPDRISTAKSISAWILDVPTVTMEYVRALVERTDANEELPDTTQFLSPGVLPMDELEIDRIGDLKNPRKALKEYKVLSLLSSEGELLCRCAGATIVPLYRVGASGKTDTKFWQNDEFWESLEEQQKTDRLVVVWLDTSNKRYKKGKDILSQKMEDLNRENRGEGSDFLISCINEAGIAAAVTTFKNLADIEKTELVPLTSLLNGDENSLTTGNCEGEEAIVLESISSKKGIPEDSDATDDEYFEAHSMSQNTNDIPCKSEDSSKSKKTDATSDEGKGLDFKNVKEETEDAGTITIADSFKNNLRDKISSSQSQSQPNMKSNNSKKNTKSQGESQASEWMTSQRQNSTGSKRSRHRYGDTKNAEMQDKHDIGFEGGGIDENHTPHISKREKKLRLPQTDNGWMCAAPQGKGRTHYKRSREEMSELGEVAFMEAAQTEFCKKLIVCSKRDIKKMKAAQVQSQTRGKDFKRFRKNSIIPGARMHNIEKIRLVAVLPKESERQIELQRMHTELEREQRAAESLFTGEGGSRRGSIQNYFAKKAPSASARSRARRNR